MTSLCGVLSWTRHIEQWRRWIDLGSCPWVPGSTSSEDHESRPETSSVENTALFQPTLTLNPYGISGTFIVCTAIIQTLWPGLVDLIGTRNNTDRKRRAWSADFNGLVLYSTTRTQLDPTGPDPTRQSPRTLSETRVFDKVWSGPFSGIWLL